MQLQLPRQNAVLFLSLSEAFSTLGSGVAAIATGLWVWDVYASTSLLALLAFFTFTPLIFFTPFAGAIVDRIGARPTLIYANLGSAATNVVMAAILAAQPQGTIGLLFALMLVQGLFNSAHTPAYSVSIAALAEDSELERANAMLSLAGSVPSIVAPALGALLYGVLSVPVIMALDALSYLIPATTVFLIHGLQPQVEKSENTFLRDVTYGFGYIWRRPELLALSLAWALYNLTNTTLNTLQLPLTSAIDDTGKLYGFVYSAASLGAVAAGAVMVRGWLRPRPSTSVFVTVLLSLGVLYPLQALTHSAYVWLVMAFTATFVMVVAATLNRSLWQRSVEKGVQGRVFSANGFVSQMTIPLANLGLPAALALAEGASVPTLGVSGDLAGERAVALSLCVLAALGSAALWHIYHKKYAAAA